MKIYFIIIVRFINVWITKTPKHLNALLSTMVWKEDFWDKLIVTSRGWQSIE